MTTSDMVGEHNLSILLRSMSPQLIDGEFVFCSFAGAKYGDHRDLDPIASYQEDEGLTLVVSRENADENGLAYDSLFRCISLKVHSSLDAVGLTAAFSTQLGERGISANVIAGYYHDHIFVPVEVAQEAVDALVELSEQ